MMPKANTIYTLFFSALLLGGSALLSACGDKPSGTFCDEDSSCEANQVCNLTSNACEARTDASVPIDAAAAADAMAALCEGGNQCVAEVPAEWIGPVVYTTADTEDELAACPVEYSEEVGVLGSDASFAADCECSCGNVTNASCSNAAVVPTNNTGFQCAFNAFNCAGGACPNIIQVSATSITSANRHVGFHVATSLGSVTSGTCSPASITSDLSSSFGSVSRLCRSSPIADACVQGEFCSPVIPSDFETQHCVARQGEFECPEDSSYTERTILHASIDDQRNCDGTACQCEALDQPCGGVVRLEVQTSQGPVVQASTPGCFTVPFSGRDYRYLPNPTPACRKVGNAIVTGNALPDGATTLCCEPSL